MPLLWPPTQVSVQSLREAVEAGLPVYAECGGLMYLGKELLVEEKAFPMTGVFPLRFVLDRSPQGHGYTILDVDTPNPYFPIGEVLHGHEFHYSHIPDWEEGRFTLGFQGEAGAGYPWGQGWSALQECPGHLFPCPRLRNERLGQGIIGTGRSLREKQLVRETMAVGEAPVVTEISRTSRYSFSPGRMRLP